MTRSKSGGTRRKPAAQSDAPTRDSYHHGDLPRALRQAAKQLLAEDGPEGLTLRALARQLGVNHRAVYRHFADKRALFAVLAREGFEMLTARLQRAMAKIPEDELEERLVAIGVEYLRFAQENTALFRLMFGPRLNQDGRFPELEPVVAEALVLVVAEMERGVALRHLRPGEARDRAISLWSLAHGYADLVLLKRIRVRTKSIARRYLRDVFAPLLAGMSR